MAQSAEFVWPGLTVKVDAYGPQIVLEMKRLQKMVSDSSGNSTVVEPEERFVVGLDKSSARSIASALMGAAASLR